MKKTCLITLLFGLLTVSAFAQTKTPSFDNFDRSQGVQVFRPEPPAVLPSLKKGKRGQRMQVVVKDNLVKKTASVTDGLAAREPMLPATKLVMGTSTQLKGFTTGNPVYDSYIVDSARRYSIDPLLIYSQMHQESSFKLNATSNKGASGLMQLMPATARRFGVTSIYDPKQNIEAGVKYMRWLLDTFGGDVILALAGYNAGEGAVMKYGNNVPPYRETQEYVRRISSRYNSISNGTYVHNARPIGSQSAKVVQKESRPLALYEPDALAVRTADGKMMLMNQ